MVLMLEKCKSFALTHDILFNASKTKYMIFKRCESVNSFIFEVLTNELKK